MTDRSGQAARRLGWLALPGIVGGMAWFGKASYDWRIEGRLAHTGYAPTQVADQLFFVAPLLLAATLVLSYRRWRKSGLMWAAAGVALIAFAMFWEAWSYGSGVPTGLLALPGYLLLAIGTIASRQPIFAAAGVLMLAQPVGSLVIFNVWGSRSSATIWEVVASGLAALAWTAAGLVDVRRSNADGRSV